MQPLSLSDRRSFLRNTAAMTAGISGLSLLPRADAAADSSINIIGPKEGYSPQIGTLVSMMNWMRMVLLMSVKGMSQQDLDYLLDSKANRIGALLLHLAATDTYYHLHTFGGKPWGSWGEEVKRKWDIPMGLGEPARKTLTGHNLNYYLN